jgi:hypothetical protein
MFQTPFSKHALINASPGLLFAAMGSVVLAICAWRGASVKVGYAGPSGGKQLCLSSVPSDEQAEGEADERHRNHDSDSGKDPKG